MASWLPWKQIKYSPDQGQLLTWPMTVEPDTVRTTYRELEEKLGRAELIVTPRWGPTAGVPIDSFTSRATWELGRLNAQRLWKDGRSRKDVTVWFVTDRSPAITLSEGEERKPSEPDTKRIAEQIEEGQPRFARRLLLPLIPIVMAALVVVAWLWTWWSERPSASIVLLGWIGVVVVIMVLVDRFKVWRGRHWQRFESGHRIRPISREELRMHRADTRRDIKVGLVTTLVGIALGAVGTGLGLGGIG